MITSIVILALTISFSVSIPPIAIMHGFGDQCTNDGMQRTIARLKNDLNTHVECIEMGLGAIDSIIGNFTELAQDACNKLLENENFQEDFSLFGISQGNLIARYIIEKCPTKGKVSHFLSLHGPHMGIGYVPFLDCGEICEVLNDYLGSIAFQNEIFMNFFAPNAYFRPRHNQQDYEKYNTFLRDLNNEYDVKKPEYKERMLKLDRMMLMKAKGDQMILPNKSSWFEFFDFEGNEIIPLEESTFYKEDWIGIRQLNEEGKIEFVETEGAHVRYTDEEYEQYIIPFFLE